MEGWGNPGKANPDARRKQGWPARLRLRLPDNPVVVRECRALMRGTRSYVLLGVYVLLLAISALLGCVAYESGRRGGLPVPVSELGRTLYGYVFGAQALLMALVVPAMTAGAVSGERERRCYDLLVATRLRAGEVVLGKWLAAVALVLLLQITSLPIVGLSFLTGGVSPAEILTAFAILVASSMSYAAIGIWWSSALRSTIAATAAAVVTVVALALGTLVSGVSTGAFVGAMLFAPPEFWFRTQVYFGVPVPAWVAGMVWHLSLMSVLLLAAMRRLEYSVPPGAHRLRQAATLFWTVSCLCLFGPTLDTLPKSWSSPTDANRDLAGLFGMVLAFCALVPPLLSAPPPAGGGALPPDDPVRRYLTGFLPHRLFRDDLSAGFPLLCLWALIATGTVVLGVATAGRMALAGFEPVVLPATLLTLGVVAGLSGINHALAVMLRSRVAACLGGYVGALALLVLPYFLAAAPGVWEPHAAFPAGIARQAIYLLPWEALTECLAAEAYRRTHPGLWFTPPLPVWPVTASLYLGIGVLGAAIAVLRLRRGYRGAQRKGRAALAAVGRSPSASPLPA